MSGINRFMKSSATRKIHCPLLNRKFRCRLCKHLTLEFSLSQLDKINNLTSYCTKVVSNSVNLCLPSDSPHCLLTTRVLILSVLLFKNLIILDFKLSPCLNIVCILLGNSPASDCGLPTFRNPLSVPSSRAGCRVYSTSSPGVRLWFADVSEPSISSIFKGWM